MKYFVLISLLVLGVLFYLNRSYAYFYNFQGSHFIANPLYPKEIVFNNERSGKDFKLVILGDSLMAGTGSSGEKAGLGYLVAQSLAGEEKLTLVNFAIPGAMAEDVLNQQLPEAIKEKPNYVILMIGTNDVHNKTTDRTFEKYMEEILRRLQEETEAKIVVVNIPYIGSDKILYPPWDRIADGRIREFNGIIKAQANAKQIEVIDLYEEFRAQFKKSSELYSFDEFHPSDKGYALWADYINKFVVLQ